MIIAEDNITTWIRWLQCQMGTFANTTANAFAYRKKNKECLKEDLILLDNIIRILYNYESFTSEPTYAYSFEFIRNSSTADTITLTIGAQTFNYAVTTEDGEDIANYYESILIPSGTNPDLYAERDGNILYVWSLDTSLNYSSTSTVTDLNSTVSSTVASLEDNLQEILDLWNCITNEELCSLISVVSNINNDCDC